MNRITRKGSRIDTLSTEEQIKLAQAVLDDELFVERLHQPIVDKLRAGLDGDLAVLCSGLTSVYRFEDWLEHNQPVKTKDAEVKSVVISGAEAEELWRGIVKIDAEFGRIVRALQPVHQQAIERWTTELEFGLTDVDRLRRWLLEGIKLLKLIRKVYQPEAKQPSRPPNPELEALRVEVVNHPCFRKLVARDKLGAVGRGWMFLTSLKAKLEELAAAEAAAKAVPSARPVKARPNRGQNLTSFNTNNQKWVGYKKEKNKSKPKKGKNGGQQNKGGGGNSKSGNKPGKEGSRAA